MDRSILSDLLGWKDKVNRRPLILHGARQVGKTYILTHLGREYFPRYHIFNFEKESEIHKIFLRDLDPYRIINELSIIKDISIDMDRDLIIFDEIQASSRALTSLKYFSEDAPQIAIASAGSLLGVQLNPGSFPVGQVDHLTLYPLSFSEFLCSLSHANLYEHYLQTDHYSPAVHSKIWDFFKYYLIVGGLPAVVNTFKEYKDSDLREAFLNVRQEQNSLIRDYLHDIAKHSGKENSLHIERVLKSIPEQLLRTIDGSAKKYIFKGVLSGRSGYNNLEGPISWLEKSGLIYKVSVASKAMIPLSAYSKPNHFKLLLFDIGILGALADIPVKSLFDYDFGTYKGYVAENFVATELIAVGREKLFSWSEGKSEIEFVIERDKDIIPIEVKSGNRTQAKSLKVFSQKYAPPIKIILSGKIKQSDSSLKYVALYSANKVLRLIL